ncbi:histamine N-methyltransferase-like [Asterias rubens]|uniref:histamine N-methyltransferase-like n=1 Tax=Asterias rubens TaxID=7604 RepID=UPI001455ACD4|nr:histamine N-methyltransferase-like [Asterias rubens]
MAESKLLHLFDDQKHYLKSFQTFNSYSAKYAMQETWTNTVLLDNIVPHLPNLDRDKQLRVFGIGSGSGEVDYPFLTALLKKYPIITNRVVEPAEDQIIKYKALVQSKGHELQGVKFDWRQQTLEQYRDTDGVGTKFHFISTIHSMYHVEDVDSSLMYLYDLLEPGGKLLVIILSDQSGFSNFLNRLPGLLKQSLRYISSAHIRRPFEARDIPCVQIHRNSEVDITECFNETSEDGELFRDFLVQLKGFRKTATPSQYKEAMEYLASSECTKKDGRKIVMNNDRDAVIVTKMST